MNYGKSATKNLANKYDPKGVKIRHKFGVIFWKVVLICVVLVGIVGISSGLGIFNGIIDSAPDISAIDVTPTGYSSTIYYDDGKTVSDTLVASGANRKYVTIDEIPTNLQHAFVAIEDARFYEHNGIDLYGITRAAVECIKSRDFSQGASTITQQLIKNNVLTSWTSESSNIEKLQRKIQEQFLALELEKQVNDKQWILENYMNSINLGANTLGVQAASQRYFNKDVSELTLSECAVIAGITQNPSRYNPITHPEENQKRRTSVLDKMLEQGYISKTEHDDALADDVYSRIAEYNDKATSSPSVNSYFTDALITDVYKSLVNDLGYSESEAYKAIYQGGLEIYSTQSPDLQAICDEEVNNQDNYGFKPSYSFTLSFQVKKSDGTYANYTNQTMLSYYKKKTHNEDFSINYSTEDKCVEAIKQYEKDVLEKGDEIVENSEAYSISLQPQVALTLIDHSTGEVKALVGGRGDKTADRTWNRATDTCRQPGSTFKIIGCYAAALDAGDMTLASVQDDANFTVGSKTFRNYDGSHRGFTNIRTGITYSINVMAVKTLQQIGVDLGYQYAENFGITTLCDSDRNLSLALGGLTNGVTNLELTGAYATIANKGVYMEPKFFTKVLDHDGNVLLDRTQIQDTHKVLKESTAWLLTSAMQDVITKGTGGRANFGTSMAKAGKSGTTTSNRDALWAGFTPYYTCVVWGGYDDNSKQNGSLTAYPKTIWKKIMGRIHENLKVKQFEKPKSITSATVCKKSGLRPISGVCNKDPRGSQNYTEYFDTATVPTSSCDHHISLEVCSESGMPVALYCPHTVTKVFIVGGSSGTQDSPYLANESFMKRTCNLHRRPPVEDDMDNDDSDTEPDDSTPQEPDDDPNNPDNTDPTPQDPAPQEPTPDIPIPDDPALQETTTIPMQYLFYSKYQLLYPHFRFDS